MEDVLEDYADIGCAPFGESLRNRIITSILNAVPTSKIYVFGSRVYGVPRPDSDLDLYVVTSRDGDRAHDVIDVRKSLLWLDCDKDVCAISERALKRYLENAPEDGLLRHEVIERGFLLFNSEGRASVRKGR